MKRIILPVFAFVAFTIASCDKEEEKDTINPIIAGSVCGTTKEITTEVGETTYTHSDNSWNVTATDDSGKSPSIMYSLSGVTTQVTGSNNTLNGQIFNIGETQVIWKAQDESGNESMCEFTITVKEGEAPKLEIPATYEFTRNGSSSVSYAGQHTRIDMHSAIKSYAAKANSEEIVATTFQKMIENSGNPFITDGAFYSATDLNESGKKIWNKLSASGVAASGQEEAYEYFKNLFDELERLSKVRETEASNGVAGMAGGKRLVDEKGFEPIQILSKSIMGALELDQIVNHYLSDTKLNVDNDNIVEGKSYTTMEHHWDEAFGYTGLPSDPNLDYSEKGTPEADKYRRFWSGYLNSISTSVAGKGIKKQIYDAFLAGRTAIVNKDITERDKQRDIIKNLMGKACAIRAVHYLVAAANEIAEDPGAVHAGAFHEGSEGVGFLYALYYMDHSHTAYSHIKAQLDQSISAIKAKGFYDETIVDLLHQVANGIAAGFGFKADEA